MEEVNGAFYFYHCPKDGQELWESDGTTIGTVRIQAPTKTPDGTVAGTSMVKSLEGPHNQYGNRQQFTPIGNRLVFGFDDGIHGWEPWVSDGTEAGTHLLKDIRTCLVKDLAPDFTSVSSPHYFQPANGRMVFRTVGGATGVTDGTPDGTGILIPNGTVALERLGSQTFVFTMGTDDPGLWRTDGTPAGTQPVVAVTSGDIGPFPSELVASGPQLFLHPFGGRLWVSDGTQAGSHILDTGAVFVVDLTDSGGTLFFKGSTNEAGTEIWRSDGTEAGTVRVLETASSCGPCQGRPRSRPSPTCRRITGPGASPRRSARPASPPAAR